MKLVISAVFVLIMFLSCSEAEKPVQRESKNEEVKINIKRFGMVTGLRPEKMESYKQLHASAWPEVLKKITECNIQNYSIYLKEIDGKKYLFSYFEYTGTDFDADMKKMAADSTTQQWWKETDPCQQPLPDAASKGQIWSNMEEVFHMN